LSSTGKFENTRHLVGDLLGDRNAGVTLVKQDLDNIAWWYWLVDGDDDDIPLLPVPNPHICIWAVGCRRYVSETKEIIHYCSAECLIRHEFDLWTRSFRPAVDYAVSRMNIKM
jgi:hypothetical protein